MTTRGSLSSYKTSLGESSGIGDIDENAGFFQYRRIIKDSLNVQDFMWEFRAREELKKEEFQWVDG